MLAATDGFLSTPSARRATLVYRVLDALPVISIHALREEGDLDSSLGVNPSRIFLSTPSARRATLHGLAQRQAGKISIHALREEGDRQFPLAGIAHLISIHALREEGDLLLYRLCSHRCNFYPRPPRGGRPEFVQRAALAWQISIHALREEGDVTRYSLVPR